MIYFITFFFSLFLLFFHSFEHCATQLEFLFISKKFMIFNKKWKIYQPGTDFNFCVKDRENSTARLEDVPAMYHVWHCTTKSFPWACNYSFPTSLSRTLPPRDLLISELNSMYAPRTISWEIFFNANFISPLVLWRQWSMRILLQTSCDIHKRTQ